MGYDFKTADLTAENTFSAWIAPFRTREFRAGYLDFVITGTWVGTITIQKQYDRDGTYTSAIDVDTYTANAAKLIEDHVYGVEYRLGFKTGEYTSGTASVRIER